MSNVMSNAERQARIRERRKAVKAKLDARSRRKGWKRITVLAYVRAAENPFASPGDTEVMLFDLDGKLLVEAAL